MCALVSTTLMPCASPQAMRWTPSRSSVLNVGRQTDIPRKFINEETIYLVISKYIGSLQAESMKKSARDLVVRKKTSWTHDGGIV